VRYYHWVFTLPAILRPLALQNQALLYRLLFDAASKTLLQFGRERFDVEIGVTALLHTWGQNLMDHPHVHCLVTGGGLQTAPDGCHRWVGPAQSRYLFPVKAVAAMFAGKFIDGLQDLRRHGKLTYEGTLAGWKSDAEWKAMIATLRSRKWIVFGKGSVTGPESVLEYLGRYTHRVAIANSRITAMTDRTVSFRYKDYRDGSVLKTMTLSGVEFLHRLSLHVLPEGFTKIRHYGLLGNNRRKRMLPLAREALKGSRWYVAIAPVTPKPAAIVEEVECPRCGAAELLCAVHRAIGCAREIHATGRRSPTRPHPTRRAPGHRRFLLNPCDEQHRRCRDQGAASISTERLPREVHIVFASSSPIARLKPASNPLIPRVRPLRGALVRAQTTIPILRTSLPTVLRQPGSS
jgi:hypothetical protein